MKKILVAPLNWGLGHAVRCVPVIKALESNGFTPVIASDGNALNLLKKEFPHLEFRELPSYKIEYARNGFFFKWKLIIKSPKIISAIRKEKKIISKWVEENQFLGIISDNRLGISSKKIPSVLITHQINVLSGNTSWITSKLHQYFIKKHKECWVPDYKESPNLSGKLSHIKDSNLKIKYIGALSRLEKKEVPKKYDLLIILSGPEPQRTILEDILKKEVHLFKGTILFIRGIVEDHQNEEQIGNTTYYNFMKAKELEQAFNESEFVICRPGYTTIMDLAKLDKKALLIPTPGQEEQLYIARRLKGSGILPYSKQDYFKINDVEKIPFYSGLKIPQNHKTNWEELFSLFNSK